MPLEELLLGWTVRRPSSAAAPVAAAAAALEELGACCKLEAWDPHELRVVAPDGATATASLRGWTGEHALRAHLEQLGELSLVPVGAVLTAYAGARLAGAVLTRRRIQLPVDRLVDELLVARAVRGRLRPEILRCRDGWAVARFRDDEERALLEALTGPVAEASLEALAADARLARLLIAPVRQAAPRNGRPWWSEAVAGERADAVGVPRVVDWTVLWAGPWATGELGRSGSDVLRVEHPRRRDGLLRSEAGTRWWHDLNGGKRLELFDGRDPGGRAALAHALESADIAFTSMTPRALESLGFDDEWRHARAPRLLHLELVAFDDPWADLPGLGEHAAAEAGLLSRGDERPAAPYSWPDPLLGALALLVCRAWLTSSRRRGGRFRLSLQSAASLAFRSERAPIAAAAR